MRYDVRAIVERMPVGDVLARFGLPARGRQACPLHGGKNDQTFSARGSRFRCFSCGAAGDSIDLWAALAKVGKGEAIRQMAAACGLAPADPAALEAAAAERMRAAAERREAEDLDGQVWRALWRAHAACRARAAGAARVWRRTGSRDAARRAGVWYAAVEWLERRADSIADGPTS